MRRLPVRLNSLPRVNSSAGGSLSALTSHSLVRPTLLHARRLANARDAPELGFRGGQSLGGASGQPEAKKPSERTVKLGKTIRTLHERMPDLLATPLPQDILSPNITLQLFPSTHPHLPSVRGRLAYTAALWTSPVAWGRVPVVGNVKLVVLSERVLNAGGGGGGTPAGGEKLVVRWRTCGEGEVTDQIKRVFSMLGRGKGNGGGSGADASSSQKDDFHGIFVFEFDDDGRVAAHTIEHVEESNNWERTARVISVTDWLLGKAMGAAPQGEGGLAGLACGEAVNGKMAATGERQTLRFGY